MPALPLALRGIPYLYTFHAPVYREALNERQGSYALPRVVQAPAVAPLPPVTRTITFVEGMTVKDLADKLDQRVKDVLKKLLDKRLIVAKGRKETVGRPMMYGTSKEFLIQFGLKDLSELPSIEDFQDLAGSVENE